MSKRIVLGYLAEPPGAHLGAWRHPDVNPEQRTQLSTWTQLAQTAERGKLDLFFKADDLGTRNQRLDSYSQSPLYFHPLEPLTLLAALAGATTHIGLGATVSTSFFEPTNIARIFASLDHLSGGRAAWNIVTSANDYAARNFGLSKLPSHDERYQRARESYEIVSSYWDTWEDDAFVYDKESARFFDPSKYHNTEYHGKFFSVEGGISVPRTPQGHPVIIQAGASPAGRDFAARSAEIIFSSSTGIDRAKEFYADLISRAVGHGRAPDSLRILSGARVIVAETEAEARAKHRLLEELVPMASRVWVLSEDLEVDLSDLPLDEPIPVERIPAESNGHQQWFAAIVSMIERGMTLREIAMTYDPLTTIVGSPSQIADHMEEWVDQGAGDGFMITGLWEPGNLDDIVDLLVPELQRRGRARREYEGTTLREHLGLPRPANRHV